MTRVTHTSEVGQVDKSQTMEALEGNGNEFG